MRNSFWNYFIRRGNTMSMQWTNSQMEKSKRLMQPNIHSLLFRKIYNAYIFYWTFQYQNLSLAAQICSAVPCIQHRDTRATPILSIDQVYIFNIASSRKLWPNISLGPYRRIMQLQMGTVSVRRRLPSMINGRSIRGHYFSFSALQVLQSFTVQKIWSLQLRLRYSRRRRGTWARPRSRKQPITIGVFGTLSGISLPYIRLQEQVFQT